MAGARNLQRFGIPWTGFELGDDVGGLWNIGGPRSTVYEWFRCLADGGWKESTTHRTGSEAAN